MPAVEEHRAAIDGVPASFDGERVEHRRAADLLAQRRDRRRPADALRPRNADQRRRLDAVPRARRRHRARPAGLRPLGQAGQLRLHDRRLRPLHRALPRVQRDRAAEPRRPRLRRGRPRLRPALPRADRPPRRDRRRAAAARLPVAPPGPHVAAAGGRRAGDGLDDRARDPAPARARSTSARCRRSTSSSVLDHFDYGTQRAMIKLHRRSPPDMLAAGRRPAWRRSRRRR